MIDIDMAECRSRIGDGLSEIIDDGFKYRKTNFEYVRKRGGCLDIFRVQFDKMTGWYRVTPSVFLSYPAVNKIFNEALGSHNPVNRPTFGFGVRNRFGHKRGVYRIESVADFRPAVDGVLRDFHEVALPWFREIPDIAAVDAQMNARNESGDYTPSSVSYACKGLIAAHLAENPDFDELAEAYYDFWANTQSPELAQPILTTRNYLKTRALSVG